MRRKLPVILAPMLLLGLIGSSTVSASSTPSLTTLSGPSPFANCTAGSPGTNYPNAEVEPWVAVNPLNSKNIVGTWQQDRWSNGGAHGLVAGYSFDGGNTWTNVTLPFSVCAPGGLPYERASDPWLSFGPDGTLYAVGLPFNQSNNNNGVSAATSSDGGKTWQNAQMLIADTSYQYGDDKESVTADPVHAGTAYAIWDRLISPNGKPDAVYHAHAYGGPTWFSRTIDGGKTWSTATMLFDPGQNNQTIGNQIVIDPKTDTLYNFFNLIVSTTSNSVWPHGYNVAFQKSTDGGVTWSAPQLVAQLRTVGVTQPNTGAQVRTGDIIPEPAIDPATGTLYVVWQDSRWNGGQYDEVAMSKSTDGGATWSAPLHVNTPTGRAAFNPRLAVNSTGVVGVSYYDLRNTTTQTTTLPTDFWFTTSTDGGNTFTNETHVAGTFDMMTAPYASGYFVGDYDGLVTVGRNFDFVFGVANSGNTANPTDILFTSIAP